MIYSWSHALNCSYYREGARSFLWGTNGELRVKRCQEPWWIFWCWGLSIGGFCKCQLCFDMGPSSGSPRSCLFKCDGLDNPLWKCQNAPVFQPWPLNWKHLPVSLSILHPLLWEKPAALLRQSPRRMRMPSPHQTNLPAVWVKSFQREILWFQSSFQITSETNLYVHLCVHVCMYECAC